MQIFSSQFALQFFLECNESGVYLFLHYLSGKSIPFSDNLTVCSTIIPCVYRQQRLYVHARIPCAPDRAQANKVHTTCASKRSIKPVTREWFPVRQPEGAAWKLKRWTAWDCNWLPLNCYRSCEQKGYLKDDFVRHFVRRPQRRAPIINRGMRLRDITLCVSSPFRQCKSCYEIKVMKVTMQSSCLSVVQAPPHDAIYQVLDPTLWSMSHRCLTVGWTWDCSTPSAVRRNNVLAIRR